MIKLGWHLSNINCIQRNNTKSQQPPRPNLQSIKSLGLGKALSSRCKSDLHPCMHLLLQSASSLNDRYPFYMFGCRWKLKYNKLYQCEGFMFVCMHNRHRHILGGGGYFDKEYLCGGGLTLCILTVTTHTYL